MLRVDSLLTVRRKTRDNQDPHESHRDRVEAGSFELSDIGLIDAYADD